MKPHPNSATLRKMPFQGVSLLAKATVICGCMFTQAFGQALEKLHSFTTSGGSTGIYPKGGLVEGTDGNLYGTTSEGGSFGHGTIFKVTPGGVLTTLVEFSGGSVGVRGSKPACTLIKGSDGNFYGTAPEPFDYLSGSSSQNINGTVFKMAPSGALTTLVAFDGITVDGQRPAGLIEATDGHFYGSADWAAGRIFRASPSGLFTTIVDFEGAGSPESPLSGVIQGVDGAFYGTTYSGGAAGQGTVFKLTSNGGLNILVEFANTGPAHPTASLLQASDGDFYGTSEAGGASGHGTIFKMTPAGLLTTLVEFTGTTGTHKGSAPKASLIEANDGYLYGSTSAGGSNGVGTLFKVSLSGDLTTLVEFNESNGSIPNSLLQATDGSLYGTTCAGGTANEGTIFKLTLAGQFTTLIHLDGVVSGEQQVLPGKHMVQAPSGDFYGVTANGGTSLGTIFKRSPTGTVTTLVEFTHTPAGVKGREPVAGLLLNAQGELYGTTRLGGGDDLGTVFRVSPAGMLTTLVEFTGNGTTNKGSRPVGTLVDGLDGYYYGTTSQGGADDFGTIYQLDPVTGALTTLIEFTGDGASNKGSDPQAGLVRGNDGFLYGTTQAGGSTDHGTLFKVSTAGVLTTLVEFGGIDGPFFGAHPVAPLFLAADGFLYGTTSTLGFESDAGTVFKLSTSGQFTNLFNFGHEFFSSIVDGRRPLGGVVVTSDGTIYGTTREGGSLDFTRGTVFKLQGGILTVLYDFASDLIDGYPEGDLIVGADGDLYGIATSSLYRLLMPGSPKVTNLPVTYDSITSVTLRAQISARGAGTVSVIEHGTDGVSFPGTLPASPVVSGYSASTVAASLGDLVSGQTYYYRVRSTNVLGSTLGPVSSFVALAQPLAQSSPPSELAQTSVRFNGVVNARSFDATVRFEWGTDGDSFPNSVVAVPATVTGTGFTPVSAPLAGLVKGTTYYYRVVATNAGGTAVSGTQSFRTLTEPTAGIGGSFALSTTSVRVDGSAHAQGSPAAVVFEYGTDGVSFPNSVAATPASINGDSSTAVSAVFTNLSQGTTYHYRVKATSDGGTGYSPVASFSMNVLSGFTQVFPNAAPDAQGFLIVNLTPTTGVLHGWRFLGEQQWRVSGVPVGGLATGDRQIEFRAVPGQIHPLSETVTITSGEAATVITRDYYETTTGGSASVSVLLKPESITNSSDPLRAQWRLLGEVAWRDSSTAAEDLIPGNYLIECKPVAGRVTPPNTNVLLSDGQNAVATITYYMPASTIGVPPVVLAYESITSDTSRPYAFVGQIRSSAGVGTGFVVKNRVVATAAHVVWNDGTQSTAEDLQWLFQRHRGLYEPAPILPRGYYIFDGYATQRIADNSPGDSSPQSQHLDVAVLYFNEDAGRQGYGGFLASDLNDNEFLLSNANKMLVGYPVDGIATTSQGRMHATAPFNVPFTHGYNKPTAPFAGIRTFITTGIRSSGGNSGGPLCVQFEGGAYYPAAIYLGGNNQTVVRAIDSAVVDMFDRAAISGGGGSNNTGGGITHTSVSAIASGNAGSVKIIIEPAGARTAGAGWRLKPETTYRVSGAQKSNLNAGTYILEMLTVPGYDTPATQNVTVTAGSLNTETYTYATLQESWRQAHFGSMANSGNGADSFDFDGDGFSNAAEYAAGTNPTLSSDRLLAHNPQRGANSFSVTTDGKSGRTYSLERSTNLSAWTTVATQGPLSYDAAVTLTDATSPNGAGFYRIRVTGPSN